MKRSYDVRTVAFACGTDAKWVDNLLSHYTLPGVTKARQGVQRRISDEGLLTVEVIRLLNQEVGVSIARAVHIAGAAMASMSGDSVQISLAPQCDLRIDVAQVEQRLRREVINAMEALAHVTRGRPRHTGARETKKRRA